MQEMKTKRLHIHPMTDDAMQALIAAEQDESLRLAYVQMLQGGQTDPTNRLWYVAWQACLPDGTPVGDLCFKGPPVHGAVELGYGVLPAYRGCGYAKEMVGALIGWAFAQPKVYFVQAETEAENLASQRVLHHFGFVPDGEGVEGHRYRLDKPAPNWLGTLMMLGLSLGVALSTFHGQLGLGAGLGMLCGTAAGLILDDCDKRERAKCLALLAAKRAEQHRASR
ncbi:MAG: GNAT family N-acetyltransferase [Candidatus Limiplasma sp.]|nr:GNAT family N-acetyltransferase [Candidatus Limiplasma sp.]MEA5144866.1 GNAT family N-acetyltransferase [Candidatus Limiplasma sp.]